ncbi:hypothetical protein ACFL2O_06020 [Thermodesulfobacteriota bacterium]
MRKNGSLFTAIVLFSVLAFSVSGCFITKPLVDKVKPSSLLKKRVLIIPIYDQTGKHPNLVKEGTDQLISLITDSSHVLIVEPSEPLSISESNRSPEFGIITPPELVAKARKMGINALITCLLIPIEASTEKTGIWPFRRLSRVFEISMIVNVVDVTTGYLYITKLDSEKISFPFKDAKEQTEAGYVKKALADAVPEIIERQASVIVDILEESPWIGNIIQVTDKKIQIDAGRDVGAQPGQVFTVFARSDSIKQRSGQAIDLRGRAVGTIRITEVKEKSSFAVAVKEGGFVAGQIISLID